MVASLGFEIMANHAILSLLPRSIEFLRVESVQGMHFSRFSNDYAEKAPLRHQKEKGCDYRQWYCEGWLEQNHILKYVNKIGEPHY